MINLLLASADAELTADELIAEAVDSLFEGLTSQLGFAILYTVVALAVLGLAVALLMYRFKRDRLKDYAKVAFGVVAGSRVRRGRGSRHHGDRAHGGGHVLSDQQL